MDEQRRGQAHRRSRDERDDGLVQLATVDESGVEVVLSEERAEVGVERVARRRVRIAKRVVVEQRVVELRREELSVEEVDAEGSPLPDAADPALVLGRSAPLELVLSEEQVVVEKRVVPRERVRLVVDRIEGDEAVTVAVRHEEAGLDRGSSGGGQRSV